MAASPRAATSATMPRTVSGAFDFFRVNVVDLDRDQTNVARKSRDHLLGQIRELSASDEAFPKFTGERELFGSFARNTKIRPLDDIDLMPILDASGLVHSWNGAAVRIQAARPDAPLAPWADDAGYVNSRRVLNAVKGGLSRLATYSNADLHRNQQAVTLKLSSYQWNFDLVPSLQVSGRGSGKTDYFLIPDGQGDWMQSDPRKAQDIVTALNQEHDGQFVPSVRLLKFWKQKKGLGDISSFAFETFVANVFRGMLPHPNIHLAFGCFFDKAPKHVFTSWDDPAGFSGDLGAGIQVDTKAILREKLQEAAVVANAAYRDELNEDHESSIAKWRSHLGNDFPTYG
jgi:hypothetical protein